MLRLPLLIALLALGLLAGCGGEEGGGGQADTAAQKPPAQNETTAPAEQNGCRSVEAPPAKQDGGQKKPSAELDAGKRYQLVVSTSCGDFTVRLDPEQSPQAAASLVSLARNDFYENTVFHRVVPGFVIQGGDPTGTGQGGPGYSTRDKPPQDTQYEKFDVALAKTGQEAAGTGGSQFFVVTGDEVGLPPDYAEVGRVVDGKQVVERIGQLGDPSTEQPTQPVVIESVDVKTSSGSS